MEQTRVCYLEKSKLLKFLKIGFVAAGILVLFTLPRIISSDGLDRWNSLASILGYGTPDTKKYSLLGPLFATPLVLLEQWLRIPHRISMHYNLFLFLILLIFLLKYLMQIWSQQKATVFGIFLLFASMFPFHTLNFYSEIFTVLCLTFGSLFLVLNKSVAAFTFLTLAGANTAATIPAIAALLLFHFYYERKWRYLAAITLPILLVLIENKLHRGSFVTFGYEGDKGEKTFMPYSGLPGFSYPFFLGLLSILFSFGKGLLFFVPAFFLPLFFKPKYSNPKIERLGVYWFVISWLLIFTYSRWWSWHGSYWGPRFMLFTCLPASLLMTEAIYSRSLGWKAKLFVLYSLVISFWATFEGLVFGHYDLGYCYRDSYQYESLCWYIPEFSALFRPLVSPRALKTKELVLALLWTITLLFIFLVWFKNENFIQTLRRRIRHK